MPLNDGAAPPTQLPAVDQFVATPVKLFHVTDWAWAAGAVKAHVTAMPSDRAPQRRNDDAIGLFPTRADPRMVRRTASSVEVRIGAEVIGHALLAEQVLDRGPVALCSSAGPIYRPVAAAGEGGVCRNVRRCREH